MKSTFYKILWAEIRCWAYLAFRGLFKFECRFRLGFKDGGAAVIAAGTGKMSDGTVKISRIFYNSSRLSMAELEAYLNSFVWMWRAP